MMDPSKSVRVKYVSEEKIECRVTGGDTPRIGEKVCIINEDDDTGILRREWFEVKDVWWHVHNHPERRPDVVEVRMKPAKDESDDEREGEVIKQTR